MQTENHEIEVEKGSGNIFADLGLEDADELLARSQIGFFVFKILEDNVYLYAQNRLDSGD